VKINTTNSFADPVSGVTYTPNATYSGSGEQVVSTGTSTSATISNLSPGQTYYLRAYEYTSTGMLYNTTTATNNPNSTTLNYPAPVLSSISPSSASAGGSSFIITVTGSDFFAGSTVQWNGSDRTTTYVNTTTLTATITSADIATAGSASVTVVNPAPGGGTSTPSSFTINSNSSPLISVSVTTLPNFIAVAGTPSVSQSYTVSGSNLTADISITPSPGYEIRTGSNGFGTTPINLTPVAGTVAATTIDVRMNTAAPGSNPGTISHSSSGANIQDVTVNGFALDAEPTTPSTITFGTISGNSIQANTSGGDGATRIIVIRAGAPVSFVPSDATTVTGVDADFNTALDQGSGNKIVYDGSGNSVTVTSLSPLTTYHFAVYEYNGSGATANYQTSGAGTANATTLAAEPTTVATVTLQRVRPDTAFTALSGGNGTGRLAVISTSPVTFTPDDTTVYSGASGDINTAIDLGSGNFLVYNAATAASISVRGLVAGTTYYLRVYEYNGSGTSINYRTSTSGNLTFTMPTNISYTSGMIYTQDFNGLPSTGTFTMTGFGVGPYYLSTPAVNASNLAGWQHTLLPGGSAADLVFAVDNGGSSSGGVKSYGTTASTNRALGSLATGSSIPCFGAVFVNNTGGPLTSVDISYTGQQWRLGGSGTPNQLAFSYALNGTSITNGTFVSVPDLNFNNPVSFGTAASLDGTQQANQSRISAVFPIGTNWMPGQTLVIRWTDVNDAGNDEGMAIDDFSFKALAPQAPSNQDSLITFANILTTSMDVSWTNGNGANRIVVMNTSNSFTPPGNGNSYTANTTYSGTGEQVVYNGSGSVVHVEGLAAGTTYYFHVYSYNGITSSTVYNTSAAQGNPASQSTAQPSTATRLAITSVNGGNTPVIGTPFSVVVQAQDSAGSPQAVNTNTTVTLSVSIGNGSIGGTLTGIIPAGSNSVTITGVTYSPEDYAVQLQASATAGMSLTAGISAPFNVLGIATQLFFTVTPVGGVFNTPVSTIEVQALRNDFTPDQFYTGAVTIAVSSGPGTISGTTTVNCVAGVATFTGISFSLPGTYELSASATGLSPALSSTITITLNPVLTELVVPKFIAAKTAAGAHNARVPFAVCLKIDNLIPNTAYDVKAGVGTDTTVTSSYGSGNTWISTLWGTGTIPAAFTTDGSGSSGPFWVYIQPTANSTNQRFAAGVNHNLRIGFVTSGGTMPVSPNFVGTKLMTALDIGNSAQSPATTDDGAFLIGSSVSCTDGKYVLIYDNTAGSGDPMSVYQSRAMIAPNTFSQSELPASVNSVFLQTSSNPVGDYGAVVPIGANNANGVRRIELRNADNTLFNAVTDADGIWSTVNTTTLLRRDVATLTDSIASLNTVSVTATATGETCTGVNDGTATAVASSAAPPVSYSWNTTIPQTTATATNLSAGNYTVTVTDASGCSASASATVSAPASASISASGPTTFCSGGSVVLSAGTADSYLWSNGETTQSITATVSGSYTVTATTASCVATSLPVTVAVNTYLYNGTVFNENMGSPTGTTAVNTYSGWQNTSPITFTAGTSGTDVRNTTASAGYTGASGGGNVYFGTLGGNTKSFTVSGINTDGYSSLSLTFGLLRGDIVNGMTLEVSTDGVNYTAVPFTQPTVANAWQLITVNSGIPASTNLSLRFSKTASTAFRLDDIKITGTTTIPTVTPSGPTTVCGSGSVVMQANVSAGIVWSFDGSTGRSLTVNTAGSYGYTATGTNGCTTTAAPVVFTVNPEPIATATAGTISCNGGTASVAVSATDGTAPYSNTGTFTVGAGTYSYVVTDANGCDDTVAVTLTQPAALTGSATASACDTYTWSANGVTYTASGTYTAVVPASNGCDSTATLTLTIATSTTNTTTASACDSYVWTVTGLTYTQSGSYSSVTGCVTEALNLTITTSTNTTTTASSCASYTWSVNGQTYTQSGTYSAVNGCDTQTLLLTINTCSGCTLNLTAYLEGYYSGTGTMVPVLANEGVTGAIGTETDTIIVELHDSLDPSIIVDTQQGLLMTDGTASITFPAASAGSSYWIVVKHRNSIQTWSALPVPFAAATDYDFSTSDQQAFGGNQREIETGVFAIYSGDINQDEFVDAFDYPLYEVDLLSFATGYYASDMNGDGFTDAFDYVVYEQNNLYFVMSSHP
jgi:hypothetical protein